MLDLPYATIAITVDNTSTRLHGKSLLSGIHSYDSDASKPRRADLL
jgi:hypothetical protein